MSSALTASSILNKQSTKLAVVAVFTALALATNYALIGVQNVKLMDTLVFVAAFFFGLRLGVGVAGSIWLVYGFINPNGVDDLLTLSFLIVGECFYALAGFALRRSFVIGEIARGTKEFQRLSLVFGLVGLLATFAYDVLTNFGSWIFRTGSFYQDLVVGNIVGAPFSIVHEASNVIFFATVAPALVVAATRLGFGTFGEKA